jgi:hypothetical protein
MADTIYRYPAKPSGDGQQVVVVRGEDGGVSLQGSAGVSLLCEAALDLTRRSKELEAALEGQR